MEALGTITGEGCKKLSSLLVQGGRKNSKKAKVKIGPRSRNPTLLRYFFHDIFLNFF